MTEAGQKRRPSASTKGLADTDRCAILRLSPRERIVLALRLGREAHDVARRARTTRDNSDARPG